MDALREKAAAYQALGRAGRRPRTLYQRAVELRPRTGATTPTWAPSTTAGPLRRGRERRSARCSSSCPTTRAATRTWAGCSTRSDGRDDEAVAALERSLALRPSYGAASNLAVLEFSHGRYAAAARAYEKALGSTPPTTGSGATSASPTSGRPGEQALRARGARARDRARREAARVNPKDAALLVDLGDCHALLGNAARARELLKQGLALAPDDVELQQHGRGGLRADRRPRRGAALAKRALELGYPRGASRTTRASSRCAPTRASRVRPPVPSERGCRARVRRGRKRRRLGRRHVDADTTSQGGHMANSASTKVRIFRKGNGLLKVHPYPCCCAAERPSDPELSDTAPRRRSRPNRSIAHRGDRRRALSVDLQAGQKPGYFEFEVAIGNHCAEGGSQARRDHRPVAARASAAACPTGSGARGGRAGSRA